MSIKEVRNSTLLTRYQVLAAATSIIILLFSK